MKQYLILLYVDGKTHHLPTREEKFENHKAWGAYLSRFSQDDNFDGGSPIDSKARVIASGKGKAISQSEKILKGYMLLKAKDEEGLLSNLHDMPLLAQDGATVQFHELNPLGQI